MDNCPKYEKIPHVKISRKAQLILFTIALATIEVFAFWWFRPDHIPHNFTGGLSNLNIVLFLLVSFIIWHPIIMDVLTWTIASHIKDLPNRKPIAGQKVAFITTIVPKNEPLSLLHKCLPAMIRAEYPHDTWVLDEGNNPKVKQICEQYGVKHFSRYGNSEYLTPDGKYTKTKGGNHNAWYDAYGNTYDIVAQIDTDFVPKPTFLIKTLGYFQNRKVAFVGTPQIYGNTQNSLIARGANEQQYSFYGTVLRGLSGMGMSLLIGANHIIRVAALKDVNHYSGHITEDLLTGMKLHAKGWKSVYVAEPLAIGEGPNTWESYFNQQMRWAYGCIDIFFHHSPKLFRKMGIRNTIYYFFLQQHYFTGIAMALSVFLLSLYFLGGIRSADVDLVRFILFYSFVSLTCWLMSLWLQRYYVYSKDEAELNFSGKIISIAVWPIWFLAFISVLTGIHLKYKVTPKGEKDKTEYVSLKSFIPHLTIGSITLLCLLSSFFTQRQNSLMIFWSLSTSVLMLSVPFLQFFDKCISKISELFTKSVQKIFNGLKENSENNNSYEGKLPDSVFLSLIVILSHILYVRRIGFYSDDWAFLGNFITSPDQSFIGLFRTANTISTQMRPMQNVLDALLYKAFGLEPLGYHIFNTGLLTALTVVFYLVLRQIKVPRIIAISIPMIYILLPNFSTDHFWYAVFQANVSMLFYFISLYAGLRALAQNTTGKIAWKAASIASLLLSILSYEVAMPLYILNLLIFWNPFRKLRKNNLIQTIQQNHSVFIVITCIALLYTVLFKTLTTTRLGIPHYSQYLIDLVTSAFQVNYGTYLLKLPYIWGESMSRYSDPLLLISGGILYLLIFWYLYTVISKPNTYFPGSGWMQSLLILSPVIFISGYAIFFTNNQVGFSPTGIENRVAIAASIGVALSMIGIIGWVSRLFHPEKASRLTFCILTALLCTANFIVINTVANFWSDGYRQTQNILSDIEQKIPAMPKGSTLILDGVCPYVGPAVVFESQWDLKGALQTIYRDPSMNADIVTPRLMITKNGLYTKIYTFPAQYPYKKLFIYNYKNKETYPIKNVLAAKTYFAQNNPDLNSDCPAGSAGRGTEIF